MEYDNKVPLCGPTEILPGVNLNATQIVQWFESRGMKVGAWVSLFGTHTTMDNFMDPKNLRSFGIPEEDYFEDYIGCPVHKVKAFISDPESSGCDWTPKCKDSSNTEHERWPMVRSDCATGIDIVASTPGLGNFEDQIRVYMERTGSWLPDLLCGLKHLGGRGEDCVGPNSVVRRDSQRSLFGGFFDYVVRPEIGCGTVGTCKLVDLTTGEETLLGTQNVFDPISDHDYTVTCDGVGKVEHTKFYYDGRVEDDHGGNGFFMGGNVEDHEPEKRVDYLKGSGRKEVKFEGYVWASDEPCFEIGFSLQPTDLIQPDPTSNECGSAGSCKLVDLTTGTETSLGKTNSFNPIPDHDYTVTCNGVGKVEHSKFYYDGRIVDDHGGNGFFMGGNVDDHEAERRVDYLKRSGNKIVKFEGYIWSSRVPCFEIDFSLQAGN